MSDKEKAKAKKELVKISPDKVSIVNLAANGESFFVVKNKEEKSTKKTDKETDEKIFVSKMASLILEFKQDSEVSKELLEGITALVQKQRPFEDNKEGNMAEKNEDKKDDKVEKKQKSEDVKVDEESKKNKETQKEDVKVEKDNDSQDKGKITQEEVKKGGRKMSEGRLNELKILATSLNSFISEISDSSEPVQKNEKKEEPVVNVQNNEIVELKKNVETLTKKMKDQEEEISEFKRTRKSAHGADNDGTENVQTSKDVKSVFGNLFPPNLTGVIHR